MKVLGLILMASAFLYAISQGKLNSEERHKSSQLSYVSDSTLNAVESERVMLKLKIEKRLAECEDLLALPDTELKDQSGNQLQRHQLQKEHEVMLKQLSRLTEKVDQDWSKLKNEVEAEIDPQN